MSEELLEKNLRSLLSLVEEEPAASPELDADKAERIMNAVRAQSVATGKAGRSRWPLFVAAAAAAAILIVTGLHVIGLMPTRYTSVNLFNVSADPKSERLYDGTLVTVSPGAKAVARGRDDARGIRQLIVLREGSIAVKAPKAPRGETAVRVETPEGLWVETLGTTFTVTRTYENEKGERNMNRKKLMGTVVAVLLVAVSEGEVRTGGGLAGEKRVATGGTAVVTGEKESPSRLTLRDVQKADPAADCNAAIAARRLYFVALTGQVKFQLWVPSLPKGWRVVVDEADMRKSRVVLPDVATKYPVRILDGVNDIVTPQTRKAVTYAKVFNGTMVKHLEAQRKKSGVAWGKTVGGLQAGLSAGKVAPGSVDLVLHLKSTAKATILLDDPKWASRWQVRFASVGGGRKLSPVLRSPDIDPAPIRLGPGKTMRLNVHCGYFNYAGDPKRDLNFDLPPGKYTVTAGCAHRIHDEWKTCPLWHGEVTTGAVDIEIVGKGKSAAGASVIRKGDGLAGVEKKILAHGGKRVIVPLAPPPGRAPVPLPPDGTPTPPKTRKEKPLHYRTFEMRKGWKIILLHDGKKVLGITEELLPNGPKGRKSVDLAPKSH